MLIAILIKHKVLFMLYKSRQVIVLGSGTVKKIIGGSYHSIPRCEFHFFFFFFFFWSVLVLHMGIFKSLHTYEGSPELAILLGICAMNIFSL